MNQSKLSSNSGEQEVLLPRNSKFKYTHTTIHQPDSADFKNPITVHHFEHIPEAS